MDKLNIIIEKKDGRRDKYDRNKILTAIHKAIPMCDNNTNDLTAKGLMESMIESAVKEIEKNLSNRKGRTLVEMPVIFVDEIHNLVEATLRNTGLSEVADSYAEYRKERNLARDKKSALMHSIALIGIKTDRDNANVGNNFSSKLLRIASETNKWHNLAVMPKIFSRAHENGDIYIHDLDSYNLTTNCLKSTEYILIRHLDGKTEWIQFKDLDKYFENAGSDLVYLPDIYVQGRLGWTKVKAMSRRKIRENEQIYHLKTRRGLGIKATAEHKIPIIRNNTEILLEVKDIKKGDKLIKSKTEENVQEEIAVLDLLIENIDSIKYGITIQNCGQMLNWLKYRYGDRFEFKRTTGDRASCKGTGLLSAEEYCKIAKEFFIPYEVKKELSVTVTKGKKSIPAYVPITPAFCRLLGYLLAEGCLNTSTNNRSINIANINPKILDDIRSCVKEVFDDECSDVKDPNKDNRVKALQINGSVYVTLFELLGVKKDAGHIDIPSFILEGSEELQTNFIFGLFEGDGSYSKLRFVYTTACENYAKKLSILFDNLGIESTIGETKCKGTPVYLNGRTRGVRNYDIWTVKVNDSNSMRTFLKKIGSIKREDTIEEYVKNISSNGKVGEEIIDILYEDDYDGYVYDLETAEHWFICNNYVVHNCLHLPTGRLLHSGFNTGYGTLNPPQRIETAAELSCILLQSTQNDMFGGQSHPNFDNDLADFLEMTEDEIIRDMKLSM